MSKIQNSTQTLNHKQQRPQNKTSYNQRIQKTHHQILIEKQLRNIVARNIMDESFSSLRYNLISIVLVPGLVNLYYTFRKHSPWKNIMMIGFPLGILVSAYNNYQQGLISFSNKDTPDAHLVRQKFVKNYFLTHAMSGKPLENIIEKHLVKGYNYKNNVEEK